jgi:hypothetical protein
VYGSSFSGTGVWGDSIASSSGLVGIGVTGRTSSTASGSTGVYGSTLTFGGVTFGVTGYSRSESDNSAGVLGVAEFTPHTALLTFAKSGLRGESANGGIGALGISDTAGVVGILMDLTTDAVVAEGRLGTTLGNDSDGGGPPWAVHAQGNIGASGTKSFLEPHDTDPMRVIQYISLEGREAGTYFRGRARFQRGFARIEVPEDFRMVTDPQGLTVQITPIGEMAAVAVVRMDLNEIVARGSRDVDFSYLVQGVRAGFRDAKPIIHDGTFVPRSADSRLPGYLTDHQKRALVENGTYNADGTVNLETARRVGWTRKWENERRQERPPARE